jgi:formylmethanofuran dehydrogenase subunit E
VATKEVYVESLLGRRVSTANGRTLGRLEEIVASFENGDCRVDEYHVGTYAFLERLAVSDLGRAVLRILRLDRGSYRVAWHQLDLSQPDRPRLRCTVAELDRLD